MKKGWIEKQLIEIGSTQTGSTPKSDEKDNYGDFIPFVKPADFNPDGSLNYMNDGLSKKGMLQARKVAAGSVLMVCIGATIGKCGYCDREVTTNQQINAITPLKGISHKFVYYQMCTEDFQRRVLLSSAQATLPIINKSKWSALALTLPPLSEQQRIVALLDEAFEGIATAKANAEKNLQNARALFESHLQSVFTQRGSGWVEKRLADCLERITYGFTNPMPTTTEGPYMITAKNVVGGRIDYSSTRRTSWEAFNTLLTDKSRPRVGDVLLTKDGTLGRVAVVDQPDTCVNQSVAVLRPNGRMHSQFMRCLLSSSGYQKRMVDEAGGATIKHIYITRVDKMLVIFPESIEEQKKLIAKLDFITAETQRLARLYQRKLAALDELKKSLLHQAFSGQL